MAAQDFNIKFIAGTQADVMADLNRQFNKMANDLGIVVLQEVTRFRRQMRRHLADAYPELFNKDRAGHNDFIRVNGDVPNCRNAEINFQADTSVQPGRTLLGLEQEAYDARQAGTKAADAFFKPLKDNGKRITLNKPAGEPSGNFLVRFGHADVNGFYQRMHGREGIKNLVVGDGQTDDAAGVSAFAQNRAFSIEMKANDIYKPDGALQDNVIVRIEAGVQKGLEQSNNKFNCLKGTTLNQYLLNKGFAADEAAADALGNEIITRLQTKGTAFKGKSPEEIKEYILENGFKFDSARKDGDPLFKKIADGIAVQHGGIEKTFAQEVADAAKDSVEEIGRASCRERV